VHVHRDRCAGTLLVTRVKLLGAEDATGTVVTLDPAEGWRQNDLPNFLEEWKHAIVVVGRESAPPHRSVMSLDAPPQSELGARAIDEVVID
jgi:hypothetical protein